MDRLTIFVDARALTLWELKAKDTRVCCIQRESSCVLLVQMPRTGATKSLALIWRTFRHHSSLAVWKIVQAPVFSTTKAGVYFTLRFSMQPSVKNSVTLTTRESAPNPHQTSPKESRKSRYAPYIPDWEPLPNLLTRSFSPDRGSGQTQTFPSSLNDMDSEQDSELNTKWLGFCMMSG